MQKNVCILWTLFLPMQNGSNQLNEINNNLTKGNNMIYAYVRVSSEKQTWENQSFAIEEYEKLNNITVDKWIEETISSRKPLSKRVLEQLLETLQTGDSIIITEISRLARNLYELAAILQHAIDKGVDVISIKENYHFKNDIQSKVMAYTFGIASEIEREMISTRPKMCMVKLKQQNIKLGRPLGAKNKKLKLTKNTEKILKYLSQSVSQTQIAKRLDVDATTMCRFLKRNKINLK